MALKCTFESCQDIYNSTILPNNESKVFGRSKESKIKDKRCSKSQVTLQASYDSFTVKVTQTGSNGGGYGNKLLKLGNEVTLHHGDIFELVHGQYPYKIVFSPEPTEKNNLAEQEAEISENPLKRKSNLLEEIMSDQLKKKNKSANSWEVFDNNHLLVFNRPSGSGSKKIACYDMDGTLITTSSGRVFPIDNNDWKILYPEIPGKLKNLVKDGFKIVLFTNQAGVAKGKNTVEGIQNKIKNILRKLGVEAQALVATHSDKYRKPMTGMWQFFTENCNDGIEVDLSSSFYVGDAAGRPEIKGKRKKDHSIADRLYALNVSLPFFTPEEHFKGHTPGPFKMPEFLPSKIDEVKFLYDPQSTQVPNDDLEVIIMVGFPGSGKSYFCDKNLAKKGYVIANRDSLGSWQKCVSLLEKSLDERKSIVIDNTNPDKESRSRYIQVAKKKKVPVRCFLYNVTLEHAKHNNKFRELSGSDHSKVNDMIFNMYKSKYKEPELSEGFKDIVKVNFVPHFANEEEEKLYKLFLLEK